MSFSAISARSLGNFSTTSLQQVGADGYTDQHRNRSLAQIIVNPPDKGNDVDGRRVVRVPQKVHQNVNDVCRDLGEPDSAGMDALDQELSVFDALVKVLLRGGLQLLLQEQDDLFHVPAGNHLQCDTETLSLDLHIRAREDLENIHDETVQDVRELFSESIHTIEDNELDVVISLLD